MTYLWKTNKTIVMWINPDQINQYINTSIPSKLPYFERKKNGQTNLRRSLDI